MKSVHGLRKQHIQTANSLSAKPNIRQVFASQARETSPARVLALEEVPASSIQNADGTFTYLMDYDGLSEGPLG